jgi:hypothetical protein
MSRSLVFVVWILAAQAPPSIEWPDTYVARLQALALIQTLNAQILASRSATVSLEAWCRDHQLASEPRIVARVAIGVDKPPGPEQRRRLEVSDRDLVKYRRVELSCGSHVLAQADNWYVPGRLSPAMNHLLETTDTPFGTAVRALEPYRQTLSVVVLWSPLADGWERASRPPDATGAALVLPDALFEHRAVLYTRDHRPFCEVHEVYRRDVLAFTPPR